MSHRSRILSTVDQGGLAAVPLASPGGGHVLQSAVTGVRDRRARSVISHARSLLIAPTGSARRVEVDRQLHREEQPNDCQDGDVEARNRPRGPSRRRARASIDHRPTSWSRHRPRILPFPNDAQYGPTRAQARAESRRSPRRVRRRRARPGTRGPSTRRPGASCARRSRDRTANPRWRSPRRAVP